MQLSSRLILGMAIILAPLAIIGKQAIAAEYQGKNVDGKKIPAQVYSSETGGVFDAQVEFKQKQALVYFEGGSRQRILLNSPVITDPTNIVGWGQPFSVNIGGGVRFGIVDSDPGNTEPVRPRLSEGLWRISVKAEDLK